MNVLLTCVGRRHYLVEYFNDFISGSGSIIGVDCDPTAPALSLCDYSELAPSVTDPSYVDFLVDVCNKYNIDFVFSLNDLEAELLSKNKCRVENSTQATVVISDFDIIDVCSDKYKTYLFSVENGIKTPKTYLNTDSVVSDVNSGEVSYPFIIKPRWGSGSIGIFLAENNEELEQHFSGCKNAVNSSFLSSINSSVDNVIIQEYIRGSEYGVDILNSIEGDFINFAIKKKIAMRAGETDKAVMVSQKVIGNVPETVANKLSHIGNLDCDFIEFKDEFYLIEMNPRFGGGYPFTHESGANHIKLLLSGKDRVELEEYEYKIGAAFAKCDRLVEVGLDDL